MPGATTRTPTGLSSVTRDGVGQSPSRPDGTQKVTGEFAYSSDMWMEDMLWGKTLRSPHPHAKIISIDTSEALALPGVYAVLTHEDVPGVKRYGLEYQDQPILALDKVRYQGEAVAIVAADHPETARRAMERISVEYEVLDPVSDSRQAIFDWDGPRVHEDGDLPVHEEHNQHQLPNLVRYQPVRTGAFTEGASVEELRSQADAVVTTDYEVGMQDQAFLGPESGMAVPAEDGGIDLYIATQWLHVDQSQIAPALGLPEDKVRLTLAGVGGAFGAREDLSMQIHACMLALRTGKPVKIVYDREESFFGHVHRHPAKMHFEHGASADGTLLYATLEIILDGGAYASATPAVVGVASSLGVGPYEIPNVTLDAYGAYTTNPPCGAMRGFGAVQACFGYESQMDKLAAELGMHPVDLRIKNAMSQGSKIITGQEIDMPLPMADMLSQAKEMPLPTAREELPDPQDLRTLPGGVANTSHGEGVVRGVGYGVSLKNLCYSEGFDDYSTARVRMETIGGEPVVMVHTAAAEVGQGLVTVKGQIARSELGVERVTIHPSDTQVGSAGSSSASRQSYMTGGAVKMACEAVRTRVFELVREQGFVTMGHPDALLSLNGGKVISQTHGVLVSLADLLGDGTTVIDETREFHHRPTQMLDPAHGQGDSHTQFGMCVHRAVVDVDVELGLVKVVALDAVQDVGKVLHPQQLAGQIQGGATQGLGLALMEQVQVSDSVIRNPSFTDYLIPTILDTPPMRIDVLEHPDPHSPYGLRGAGEPGTLSSTPAVVAAVRDATGKDLTHAPVRPEDIVGIDM